MARVLRFMRDSVPARGSGDNRVPLGSCDTVIIDERHAAAIIRSSSAALRDNKKIFVVQQVCGNVTANKQQTPASYNSHEHKVQRI